MNSIVIVDDDPTNTGLLEMLLELEGLSTHSCINIPEAKIAAAKEVDAFVIDCHLAQGVSGISLLKDIRAGKTAADPQTIVIMVSGDSRLEIESLEYGADKFLQKPYPLNKLTDTLNTLLAQKEHSG